MKDDKGLVDFSNFDPSIERLPFPPTDEDYRQARKKQPPQTGAEQNATGKPSYSASYWPDPATPDPSQTMPGAPDIRDTQTAADQPIDTASLSPDIDLKE